MSYWGAQVIINLFGAVPFIGPDLSEWIRGDFVVSDATLNRFFSLHVIAVPWQWSQIAAWRANALSGPADFIAHSLQSMYWPIQITSAVTTLALAAAFGWTAWKLARPDIRAEFLVT